MLHARLMPKNRRPYLFFLFLLPKEMLGSFVKLDTLSRVVLRGKHIKRQPSQPSYSYYIVSIRYVAQAAPIVFARLSNVESHLVGQLSLTQHSPVKIPLERKLPFEINFQRRCTIIGSRSVVPMYKKHDRPDRLISRTDRPRYSIREEAVFFSVLFLFLFVINLETSDRPGGG